MQVILLSGALTTLFLGAAIVLLLRTFPTVCISYAETFDRADPSWRDYGPFQRLLAPEDFAYLRRRGVAEAKITQLQRARREIYRLCLRGLARDFNRVHLALNLVLVQAQADRRELAATLTRQRFDFYRNLFKAEARIALHSCGLDPFPAA